MNDLIHAFSSVEALKTAMLDMGGEDPTTTSHHFASGSYVRECHIPAGTVVVGKIHRFETLNILLSGEITIVVDGEESKKMIAPCVFVAPAGSQKAGYAHTDTVWLNVHTSEGDDLEAIERKYICNDLEELK